MTSSAIRQLSTQVTSTPVHLFTPRPAVLAGGPSPATTSAGRNPPFGANVYFWLATVPDSAAPLTLEFLDGGGKVLQTYTRASGSTPALRRLRGAVAEARRLVRAWTPRRD